MDTKKECMIPQCGDLPDLTVFRLVVGTKQLRKALESGRARHVYLAENADPGMTVSLAEDCTRMGVPCTWVRSMKDLGRACGIEVGAASAAVVD